MIRPVRGDFRALGLRFRWAVYPFTIQDAEDWLAGGRFRRDAARRRIRASFLARVFGFRSIGRGVARQFTECGLPEALQGGGTAAGNPPPRHRDAAAVCAATGLTAQEQAEHFTLREWIALVAHLSHVEARRIALAVAAAGGKAKEPEYPDIETGEGAGKTPDREDVLSAWAGGGHGTA